MVKLMTNAAAAPRTLNYMAASSPLKLGVRSQGEQPRGIWRSAIWQASSLALGKSNAVGGQSIKAHDNQLTFAHEGPYLNYFGPVLDLPYTESAISRVEKQGSDNVAHILKKNSPCVDLSIVVADNKLSRLGLDHCKTQGKQSKLERLQETLQRSSILDELDEFQGNSEQRILMFPDYFAEEEKDIVIKVAGSLGLEYQRGERNLVVLKTGSADKKTHLLRNCSIKEDLYVNVSELAQHGKEGFSARLRLRRMNSGSGTRRNMLWDVAQLSTSEEGMADPVEEGVGGVYTVQSRLNGQKLAIFKPAEEEKFIREGLQPGEGAIREEVAYVLDSRMNGFSGVPPTAVARINLAGAIRSQKGAVQRFMSSHKGSMEGFGMPRDMVKAEKFVLAEQVHRIGLLDIRMFNTDRHSGNILLIGEKAPFTMVPIDHGCILPSWFHLSEARFDWLQYPQCEAPFSARAIEYVSQLDAEADAVTLRRLGVREECIVTLKICTKFMKIAVVHNKTLSWMGKFMQRTMCFRNASKLERCVLEACERIQLPLSILRNQSNEDKMTMSLGILSRRPPLAFMETLELIFQEKMKEE
uniref:Sporangia induced phosphatidyl inositol kinase puta n=1 Tax=Albugo laibachii Nc14 TaxID=890382 RepID=F0W2U8_9STRA|nr:sporangia induced phosphatidyl inositol kinase puta [Albugo laibachii Nc14]|eukprot:CCA15384.1 sporangia induced phosphatidyl inositol kinase puta [Albugo laibachii Nc14]